MKYITASHDGTSSWVTSMNIHGGWRYCTYHAAAPGVCQAPLSGIEQPTEVCAPWGASTPHVPKPFSILVLAKSVLLAAGTLWEGGQRRRRGRRYLGVRTRKMGVSEGGRAALYKDWPTWCRRMCAEGCPRIRAVNKACLYPKGV